MVPFTSGAVRCSPPTGWRALSAHRQSPLPTKSERNQHWGARGCGGRAGNLTPFRFEAAAVACLHRRFGQDGFHLTPLAFAGGSGSADAT